MPNLLHRSQRKLDEAAFFLTQLREGEGKEPEFGYYLSAFLSALRSVGLVLQSDLRGRFGERFDIWWQTARAALPKPRIPFRLVVELRNQALKEGELLPGLVVVAKLKHHAIDTVSYTIDLSHGRIIVVNEQYTFRADWDHIIEVPADARSDVLKQKVWDEFIPAFAALHRALNETGPDFAIASLDYLLDPAGPAVPFDEVIAGFAEHVDAMREMLCRASQVFEDVSTE